MSLLAKAKSLGVKTETTEGTAATLTSTDFIQAFDISGGPEIEQIERAYAANTMDQFPELRGKKWGEVKFKTLLQPGASATSPVAVLDALMQASGLVGAAGSSNYVWSPTSALVTNFDGIGKSATVKLYEGSAASGLLKIISGCRFTPKFTLEVGKPAVIEWDGKGTYAAVTDAAAPTLAPVTTNPLMVTNISFAINFGASISTLVISKLDFDFGNQISERLDANNANNVRGFFITNRKPSGSFDPELTNVATHDFYGIMAAGTTGTITATLSNGTRSFAISFPVAQYGKIAGADRNGIATLTVPFTLARNTGDDWATFTQA